MKTIGAAKFKAECLGLMDEVEAKGQHIVITKKGRPVAKLVPFRDEEGGKPLADLYVGGIIHGEIVRPLVDWQDYKALR